MGDQDILADRILELATDEGARSEMSEFNRKYVKEFHIDGVARQYEAIFSSVLEPADLTIEAQDNNCPSP